MKSSQTPIAGAKVSRTPTDHKGIIHKSEDTRASFMPERGEPKAKCALRDDVDLSLSNARQSPLSLTNDASGKLFLDSASLVHPVFPPKTATRRRRLQGHEKYVAA